MGSKNTQKTTSSNQYQYIPPPTDTASAKYYDNVAKLAEGVDYTTDVINGFGQAENEIKESGNSIFGADTSAELRDKVMSNRLFRNRIEKGQALANAKQNEMAAKNTMYMTLGQATAPQLVQTGGTTNSVQQSNPGIAGIISSGILGAAQLGSAAMTGGASLAPQLGHAASSMAGSHAMGSNAVSPAA